MNENYAYYGMMALIATIVLWSIAPELFMLILILGGLGGGGWYVYENNIHKEIADQIEEDDNYR